MGTKATKTKPTKRVTVSIADALFSRTKQRVLRLMFGQPDRAFGMLELIGLAESGSGAVQRELERLVASGLVVMPALPQKRYRANRDAPIFEELRAIVEKTSNVPDLLRSTLASIGSKSPALIADAARVSIAGAVARCETKKWPAAVVSCLAAAKTVDDVFHDCYVLPFTDKPLTRDRMFKIDDLAGIEAEFTKQHGDYLEI